MFFFFLSLSLNRLENHTWEIFLSQRTERHPPLVKEYHLPSLVSRKMRGVRGFMKCA